MIAESLLPIANHLWQSTLFAGAAGLLTLVLRKNPARVRHWVWIAASLKFLVPFALLIAAGNHIQWRTGTAANIGDLAVMLSLSVGRKVIDETGLTGKYDITLKYTPDENQRLMMAPPGAPPPPAPTDTSGPSLFTGLQEQLGLKLESQKGPVEIFVIDRAEKPSEN